MADARQDDYGFTITLTLKDSAGSAVDISNATTKQFVIRKPGGTVSTVTAAFSTDGTDGKLVWTSTDGFFDAQGRYKIEANVTDGSTFKYRSSRVVLVLDDILE